MINKTPNSLYTVRFNDCDLFGHLNNSRYLDYFLNAREDHLRNFYGVELSDWYQRDLAWVIGSHEIVYLRPANYNETVTIQTALLFAGEDHLHLEALMTNKEQTQLKALMRTKLIPVNPKTIRKAIHPADFMDWAKIVENPKLGTYQTLQDRLKGWRPITNS